MNFSQFNSSLPYIESIDKHPLVGVYPMPIYSTSYVTTISVKPRVDGEKRFNDIKIC
jgi:hypothetical protein